MASTSCATSGGAKFDSLLNAVLQNATPMKLENVSRAVLTPQAILMEETADGPIAPVAVTGSLSEAVELAQHHFLNNQGDPWGYSVWDRNAEGQYQQVADIFP